MHKMFLSRRCTFVPSAIVPSAIARYSCAPNFQIQSRRRESSPSAIIPNGRLIPSTKSHRDPCTRTLGSSSVRLSARSLGCVSFAPDGSVRTFDYWLSIWQPIVWDAATDVIPPSSKQKRAISITNLAEV